MFTSIQYRIISFYFSMCVCEVFLTIQLAEWSEYKKMHLSFDSRGRASLWKLSPRAGETSQSDQPS